MEDNKWRNNLDQIFNPAITYINNGRNGYFYVNDIKVKNAGTSGVCLLLVVEVAVH